MSGDSSKTQTQNTSQTNRYEPWVSDASKDIFNKASGVTNTAYTPYAGDRTADFGSTWNTAKDWLQSMIGTSNPDIDAARAGLSSVGAVSDPTKTATDYMNPYLSATLTPTLRKITEGYDRDSANLGASAASAGAFGDSGTAVQRALMARDKNNSIGDATASLTSKAYDAGTAEHNTVLQRIMSLAQGQAGLGQQQYAQNAAMANAGAGMGASEQAVGQKATDSLMADAKTGQTFGLDQLTKLTALLKGLPTNTTQTGTGTTVATQPDNTGMALLGSIMSSVI